MKQLKEIGIKKIIILCVPVFLIYLLMTVYINWRIASNFGVETNFDISFFVIKTIIISFFNTIIFVLPFIVVRSVFQPKFWIAGFLYALFFWIIQYGVKFAGSVIDYIYGKFFVNPFGEMFTLQYLSSITLGQIFYATILPLLIFLILGVITSGFYSFLKGEDL
ncbi:hypothetical protein GF362_03815 [Candidatus Dojkabacteria bacterium]|nr:hypothetical protein [Candidatus Dojkabacteria bacterium]